MLEYTKYIYHEEVGDYVATKMTKEECREYLTGYYKDNEILDEMISVPNKIPTMFGYVQIVDKQY